MLCEDVFLLARAGGETVGFVQFGDVYRGRDGYRPFGAQPGDKEVRRLYVLAAFQNCGVGSSLMDAALGDHAGKAVFLDVWEDNAGARRFYERYGFRRVGTRAFRAASGDVTGVDLVMVRRPLTVSGR